MAQRSREKLTDFEYQHKYVETDKAVQLEIDGKRYWLPKSQIELNEADRVVTMPKWLAIDKELA